MSCFVLWQQNNPGAVVWAKHQTKETLPVEGRAPTISLLQTAPRQVGGHRIQGLLSRMLNLLLLCSNPPPRRAPQSQVCFIQVSGSKPHRLHHDDRKLVGCSRRKVEVHLVELHHQRRLNIGCISINCCR